MIGFPGTLASDSMDYYITTKEYTPASFHQHFSENVVSIPNTQFTANGFSFVEPLPEKSDLNLPEDKFILCCFNAEYRIDRRTFEIWLDILKQSTQSILWLMTKPDISEKLLKYAQSKGISKDRFVFTEKESMTQRGLHRHADIMLDTMSVTSGTAAVIALWSGVPILSVAGNTPQSRTCHSVLAAAHLQDLSLNSNQEYIEKVVELTKNKERYNDLVQRLENVRNSPLFDPKLLANNLDNAYLSMYKIWHDGQSPRSIELN